MFADVDKLFNTSVHSGLSLAMSAKGARDSLFLHIHSSLMDKKKNVKK